MSIALTDSQRRGLAEMGIDVWIRRALTPAAVATEDHVRQPRRTPEPPAMRAAPITSAGLERTPATAEVRVTLESIAAPGIVVVGEFANSHDHRLAQDILLAIAGMNAKPQKAQFRWPQTQTGDSSVSAARNAYRGFLRGQIERANARLLLLFGAGAASLLDQGGKLSPETLQLPEIHALRVDPNAKKELWLNVSRRIPG